MKMLLLSSSIILLQLVGGCEWDIRVYPRAPPLESELKPLMQGVLLARGKRLE